MSALPASASKSPPPRAINGLDDMLSAVQDAVIVFTVAGAIKCANLAAREKWSAQLESLPRHPEILPLLREAALGRSKLPQRLSLPLEVGKAEPVMVTVVLTAGPANNDFALVIPSAGGGSQEDLLTQLIDLFRQDLINPAKTWLRAIAALDGVPEATVHDCVMKGADVVARLGKVIDLVELFGPDAIAGDDRVEMMPLVQEVWVDLQALAEKRRIQVCMSGFHADLPPVYGNRRLLLRAIRECLENAIKHSRQELQANEMANIEIQADLSGEHLRLTVKNYGVGILPHLSDRLFLPFNQAGQAKPKDKSAATSAGLGLGLPLCRRIIEIHGGFLRLESNHDDMTEAVIELPTGAPQRDASRLGGQMDIAQAQRYAEDIAKLMQRKRAQK
ncbi:MAG: hypothetical protein JNM52_07510 [Betaproteobacteria bacterium]|nr:hypothetical protein [Betaproteobacteria bacterium]